MQHGTTFTSFMHFCNFSDRRRLTYVARSVTVKDIAQRAAVSIATVSRALNNTDNITEEVQQRVLKAAEELGYFKAKTARDIERPLKKVGFLLHYSPSSRKGTDDFFWTRILSGAEAQARKAGIQIFFQGILDQSPYQLQAHLHEIAVDGILLVGPTGEEVVRAIQKANIPLVLVDNYLSGLEQKVDAVLSDNYEGARQIVHYLISQGHQHIAYIGSYQGGNPTRPIYTFEWRKKGYCAALAEAGLSIQPQLIQESDFQQPEKIYDTCRKLLEAQPCVSAIFCANDPGAVRVIKSLRQCGLRVPEDISVVGFDNVEMAEHITPALTTVHVHKEAMGAQAINALILRAADPEAINVTHTLGVELVIRDSVRSYQSPEPGD
jgi:DNA-binding LacI/PurR family transcriptional regulator